MALLLSSISEYFEVFVGLLHFADAGERHHFVFDLCQGGKGEVLVGRKLLFDLLFELSHFFFAGFLRHHLFSQIGLFSFFLFDRFHHLHGFLYLFLFLFFLFLVVVEVARVD